MSAQRPIFDPEQMAVHKEAPSVPRQMSVGQLTSLIKRVLGDQLPGTIHLVGEISNFTRATSKHLYMTLKDDRSEIRAVMWRSDAQKLKFKPEDGMEVVATGHVDVYEERGQYQFYIRKLEPKGTGALELAFRQLHDRLKKEGLFDTGRKRRPPRFPGRIAIVTSPTGAAVRDLIQTLRRRFPCVSILLYPVRVQGEGAAAEIAAAVEALNRWSDRLGRVDVIIVGRGGGSLEDLWAFNEEKVARAVYASRIPVISGVGHEVDTTICDLVADVRAATPTAAAEIAVPVLDDILQLLVTQSERLRRGLGNRLEFASSQLDAIGRIEWFRDPLSPVRRREQRLDELAGRLRWGMSHSMGVRTRRLHELEALITSIQPMLFIQRRQGRLADMASRFQWAMQRRLLALERQHERAWNRLHAVSPAGRIERLSEKTDRLQAEIVQGLAHRLALSRQRLESLSARLEGTSYRRTLARGFSITRSRGDQRIITSADQVSPGDEIVTQTGRGAFTSRVSEDDK